MESDRPFAFLRNAYKKRKTNKKLDLSVVSKIIKHSLKLLNTYLLKCFNRIKLDIAYTVDKINAVAPSVLFSLNVFSVYVNVG